MPAQLTRGFLEKVVRGSGWSLSEVESLSLEGESIASLGGSFEGVRRLVFLSLAQNNLTSLQGIEHLSALATAILRGNRLSNMREIDRMAGLVNLRNLDLRLNPIMNAPRRPSNEYSGRVDQRDSPRAAVLKALPRLLNLDGREVYKQTSPRQAAARGGRLEASGGVERAAGVVGRSESSVIRLQSSSSSRNDVEGVSTAGTDFTRDNGVSVSTASRSLGGERRRGAEYPGPHETRPLAGVFLRSGEGRCAEVLAVSTGALDERGDRVPARRRAADRNDGGLNAQVEASLMVTDRPKGGIRRRDRIGTEAARSCRRGGSATAVENENLDDVDLSTSTVGGDSGSAQQVLNARGTTARFHHGEECTTSTVSDSDDDNIAALWLELGAGSLQLQQPPVPAAATAASRSHENAERWYRKSSGCSKLAPAGREDYPLFEAGVAEPSSCASYSGASGQRGHTPRVSSDPVSRQCLGRGAGDLRQLENGGNTGESRQETRETGRASGNIGRCTDDDGVTDDRCTGDQTGGLVNAGAGKVDGGSSSGNDAFDHSVGPGLSVGSLLHRRVVDPLLREDIYPSPDRQGAAKAGGGDRQESFSRHRHSTATSAVPPGSDNALPDPPIDDAAVAAAVTGDGPADVQAMPSHSSAAARAVEAFRQSSQRLGLLENRISSARPDATSGGFSSDAVIVDGGEGKGGAGKGTGVRDVSGGGMIYGSGGATDKLKQSQPSRGPPVALTQKEEHAEEEGEEGGQSTSTLLGGAGSLPVKAAVEASLPAGAESSAAPAPTSAGLDTTTTTTCVEQRGVISDTASRQSSGRVSCSEEDGVGKAGIKERILTGGHGSERMSMGGRELRERWRAREKEFARKWAEREAEFDARWAAREREFDERRHEEAKDFTRGMRSMLMEAHEALMASNAWLVARLKAVESTQSSMPVGSETNNNRDDSGVPPSTVCNRLSDHCHSCSKPLAGNRTPSPTRRIPLAYTATAALPGGEGALTEIPRLQKNDALETQVDSLVSREGSGIRLGREAGAGETAAFAAGEGWPRKDARSEGEELPDVRQAIEAGAVVPFADGVEKDSLEIGGGRRVEEVSGSTLRVGALIASSSDSGNAVRGEGVATVNADGWHVAPTTTRLPSAETTEALLRVESTTLVVVHGATDTCNTPMTTPGTADEKRPMCGGKKEGRSLLPGAKLGLVQTSEGGQGQHGGDGSKKEPVFPPPTVPSVSDESCRVHDGGGVACHEPEVTVSASTED